MDSPRIPVIDEESETTNCPSPDMRPSMHEHLQAADNDLCEFFSHPTFTLLTCKKAADILPNIFQDPQQISAQPHSESTVSTEDIKKPELVIYTPAPSSRSSSFHILSSSSEEPPNVVDYEGHDSPPPLDERIANTWNERRYRLLLIHDYHPSRQSILQVFLEFSYSYCFLLVTLPLWDPSPVEVGAVGYLSKPQGHFVTLFNALAPSKAIHLGIQSLPSIHGYGRTKVETHRQDRRTVTQKSIDAFAGLLTFRTFSYVTTALAEIV